VTGPPTLRSGQPPTVPSHGAPPGPFFGSSLLYDGAQPRRRVRVSLLASGMRWRARSSLAMLAIAAFAAGAGAFGPMYLHGTDQVALDGTLQGASPRDAGLTLVRTSGHGYPGPLLAAAHVVPRPGHGRPWFGKPIVTQFSAFITATPTGTSSTSTTPGNVGPAKAVLPRASLTSARRTRVTLTRTTLTFVPRVGHKLYLGSLASRTGVCAHLKMVAGRCALGHGVAIISTRTAVALNLSVGEQLNMGFVGTNRAASMQVVGVYAPATASAPYWWGQSFFPFGTYGIAGAYEHLDDVFASPETIRALAPANRVYPTVQVALDRRSISVDQVPQFRQALARFQRAELHAGNRVGTRLYGLLSRAATIEGTVTDIIGIVDIELALLAVAVLYFVASRTASEREPDVWLAELRGYRPTSALAVALAEPVVVVLLAVPVGFLASWIVMVLVSPTLFGPRVGVGPLAVSVVAAAVAGVVGVLAAAFGARRGLLASGIEGPPGDSGVVGPIGTSRWSVVADAIVVAAAGAAFFELVVTGESRSRPHPLAALAPGLLAVAVGVLVARGLPRLLTLTHRRSAFSPRVPLALASRVVARRREFAGQVLVVTLAVGLLVFAVCAWSIATTNRNLHAAFSVGAAKVLTVSAKPGTTFLEDVRAADPRGRDAMAAVVEHSSGGTMLAVDATRMAAIVTWPSSLGMSVRQAANRLRTAHVAPSVMLKGTSVEVTAESHFGVTPAPDLTMDLFNLDTQTPEQVTFGPVSAGTHTYRGLLSYLCTGGCRLVDLTLSWSPAVSVAGTGRTATVSLRVRSLAERRHGGPWTPLHAGLADLGRWTSPTGGVRLRTAGGLLDGTFRLSPNGTPVAVAPRDVPRGLPVLVTPATAGYASGDGGPQVAGLDGGTVPGHTVGVVPSLPGVGTGAVLSNLRTAELFLSGPFTYDVTQVWLSKHAPPSIGKRLRAHGILVRSSQTAAGAQRVLNRDGISFAYLLYLVSAVAAALLVVGATGFALISASRRREDELAALRAVGVGARFLRKAVWLEQALVLGSGLVAGTGVGLVAAVLVLRSVPEFAFFGGGPPLDLGIPPLVVGVTAGVLVVALALLTAWYARVAVRKATPDRLGAAQG